MPAALNRSTARLVDPAQEDRFLATPAARLRRDVLLVAGLVLAYNVVFFVVTCSAGRLGAAGLSDHVVLAAPPRGDAAVGRTPTYRATARVVVVASASTRCRAALGGTAPPPAGCC